MQRKRDLVSPQRGWFLNKFKDDWLKRQQRLHVSDMAEGFVSVTGTIAKRENVNYMSEMYSLR